jgi:hypothetical protein
MMLKLLSAGCIVVVAVIGAAPANANKGGPSNACGFSGPPGSANPAQLTPGNSATSPGSTHNEGGINSPNGGTGGNAYNSAGQNHLGAPSQYDNSCANVTANSTNPNGTVTGAGTPLAPGGLLQMVMNNAKATRPTSHTGAGK